MFISFKSYVVAAGGFIYSDEIPTLILDGHVIWPDTMSSPGHVQMNGRVSGAIMATDSNNISGGKQ